MTPRHRQRGALLIAAVALILIMGLLGSAATFSFIGQQRISVEYRQTADALAVAESGLEKGIRSWKTTLGYSGEAGTIFGAGAFTITLWNSDAAGNPLPPGQMRIRSEGTISGIDGTPVTRIAEAIVSQATGSGFSAGKKGEARRWDGSNWIKIPSGTGKKLRGSFCRTDDDCWLVGDTGRIRHWDGTSLTPSPSGTTKNLEGVACQPAAPGHCFAVGNKGRIRRWNGSAWINSPSGTSRKLLDVHCPSAICYAVGEKGIILRFDGSNWSLETSGTNKKLRAVTCTGNEQCWAVGDDQGSNYTFVQRTAGGWNTQLVGAPAKKMRLEGVACINASDCWATGKRGKNLNQYTFVHWDGLNWNSQLWGSGAQDLKDIACLAGGECWAVGKKGRILHYGGSWSLVPSGTGRSLNTVHFPP
ncbi:MAG: hypothetical protein ACE5ET_01165 [Gammaproteobacteria bacterium]